MKYSGRIMSLLIVATSFLSLILYHYYSQNDIDRIYIFASAFYLLFGWQLGKQYDKVKFNSEKDVLTGSYNRRFLGSIFPKLKKKSDRKAQKLFICLIDVDNFKSINDRYDHAMGDRVLQLIADNLKKSCRGSDYIVRWGGDEFVGIFPCAGRLELHELQLRLHTELNRLSNRASVDVTVSVGCASYPDDGEELNDLIRIADRNMYSDKRSKKNSQIIGRLAGNRASRD